MAELVPSLRPSDVAAPSISQERAQEAAIQQQAEENKPSWGDTWDAAKQRNFLYKALGDIDDRESRKLDPDFEVTADTLKPLAQEYDQRELDFIAKAVNEQDFQSRIQSVGRNRENLQTIQKAGLTGMGAEVLASIVDPTMLPLMIGTGGTFAAGRAGLAIRSLRAAWAGAAVAGGTEAALLENDTTKDWSDVALSAATGGVISGAIPGVVRMFKRPNGSMESTIVRDEDAWSRAVEADAEVRDLGRVTQIANDADEVQAAVPNDFILTREPRQALIDELMPEAGLRLNRKDRVTAEQRSTSLAFDIKRLTEEEAAGRAELHTGYSNKQRKRMAADNNARRAEYDERIRPLQEELDAIRTRLGENEPRQRAWQDISRINNGVIPERLQDRFAQLQEAQRGPIDRIESELASTRSQGQAARAESESGILDSANPEAKSESTAGAAQVAGVKFDDEMHLVSEQGEVWDALYDGVRLAERAPRNWQNHLFPGRKLKDYAQSAYSTIDAAPSNLIRGLNLKLNANPQAGLKGHIPAAHYQDMYMRRAFNAEGGLEREAALAYAKARGIPGWKFELGIGNERLEFDNLVVLHMRGKVTSTDPDIQKAAQGRAQMLKEALEMRKAAGVRGFEEVTHDARYMPFVLDTPKLQAAYRKFGEKKVEDLLTGAYQKGRMKLSETSARIIAKAQMRRTLDKGLDTQAGTNPIFSKQNIGFLKDELETLGLKRDQIDDMLADMEDVRVNESVSKRAKFSLGASISHAEGDLRMVDLLNTSQDVILNYAREGAGEAALARQGFRTRREADQAIDEAVREARNLLQTRLGEAQASGDKKLEKELVDALGGDNSGRLAQYQEMLHDSVRQIMGESLDVSESQWVKNGVRASRGLRKLTGILRLGWNGVASIAENSNSIVSFGLATVLKNVPKTRWLQLGKYKERPELEAMHSIMGAYAHKENYFLSKNYTAANMGEDASSRFERIYNNASGWVQDKNMLLSFFRTVQNGGEELAQRSLLDRLMRAGTGELEFKDKDLNLWREAGLDDDEFDEVLNYIRTTPEYVKVDGKDVRVFSADSMTPDLRDKLGAAMSVVLGRQMQRNFIGESSIWVNKEMGKLITQFRTFSLVSLEKQLAYGLRGNTAVLAQKLMWSTFLAYMAYNARVYVQASTKPDPDEFIEKSTGGMAEVIGVLNMNNIYGGLGVSLDGLATVNALPDSWMSGGKSWGFKGYGVDSVPAVGVVNDARGLAQGTTGALRSLLSGEGVSEEESEKMYKKAMRLAPLINTATLGSAIAVANQ